MEIDLAALLDLHLALVDGEPAFACRHVPLHVWRGGLSRVRECSIVLIRRMVLNNVGVICVKVAVCVSSKRAKRHHLIIWLE